MSRPISGLLACRKGRGVLLGFVFIGGLAGGLSAQSTPEEFNRFEVASIRPSGTPGARPSMEGNAGGGVRATNVTLKLLIEMAYDVRPEQLSGGPGWTDSEEYDLVAKAPEGGPALSEAAQMELTRKRLQALLRERFRLALKLESSLADGYSLTVAKKGQKMTPALDPGTRPSIHQVGRWEIHAEGTGMSALARFLGVHLRATVIDQTRLDGRYNFELNWTPETIPTNVASLNGLPEESLIPAVEEQLGLKLERRRVATDRYRIEGAERPTEN